MYCRNCGEENPEEAVFCKNCGTKLKDDEIKKTVIELYAPVSGKVVAVNEELSDNPEYVNESPYEQAWMITVELTNETEAEELMDADAYAALIEE